MYNSLVARLRSGVTRGDKVRGLSKFPIFPPDEYRRLALLGGGSEVEHCLLEGLLVAIAVEGGRKMDKSNRGIRIHLGSGWRCPQQGM